MLQQVSTIAPTSHEATAVHADVEREMRLKLAKLNQIMDHAEPEWQAGFQTISFQSLGIQSPLRVYHNEENPAEGTRVDLASLHMIIFGTPEFFQFIQMCC